VTVRGRFPSGAGSVSTTFRPGGVAGARMTIQVYTVSATGVASEPRTTVDLPFGWVPEEQPPFSSRFPPCSCPRCR
jgi:uncharacterized protein YceK